MTTLEEMKTNLAQKVIEVMDLCDAVMKEEGHIGALEITVMLFIEGLYRAAGRPVSRGGDMLKREELIYPLPPLVIGGGEGGPEITVETTVEGAGDEAAEDPFRELSVEPVEQLAEALEPQPLERH